MSRRRVRHSWFWSWYYGLPFEAKWRREFKAAVRAGSETAKIIQDRRELMADAPTGPLPRILPDAVPPCDTAARRGAPRHRLAVPVSRREPGGQLAL